MKLGSQTGSVINHLQSRETKGQPDPQVGMGATMLMWSDRRPATIISVERYDTAHYDKLIFLTLDRYTVVSGSVQDGSAVYEYETDTTGTEHIFVRSKKDGAWVEAFTNVETGRLNARKGEGAGLKIGVRERYYDPSF